MLDGTFDNLYEKEKVGLTSSKRTGNRDLHFPWFLLMSYILWKMCSYNVGSWFRL